MCLRESPRSFAPLGHREEAFGRDDELCAGQGRDRIAQRVLGLALGIDVGGIEEIDAELEGMGDQAVRLASIDPGAEGEPGTERELADSQTAAAQSARSHAAQSSRSDSRVGGAIASRAGRRKASGTTDGGHVRC